MVGLADELDTAIAKAVRGLRDRGYSPGRDRRPARHHRQAAQQRWGQLQARPIPHTGPGPAALCRLQGIPPVKPGRPGRVLAPLRPRRDLNRCPAARHQGIHLALGLAFLHPDVRREQQTTRKLGPLCGRDDVGLLLSAPDPRRRAHRHRVGHPDRRAIPSRPVRTATVDKSDIKMISH